VIFRATEQWFISMESQGLRRAALAAIEEVRWIPPWGKDRIRGMIESRPDWCISRQRSWGVPIPAVYCKKCNDVSLTQEFCEHIAAIFETEGSDAWFARPLNELLPPGFRCVSCRGEEFYREQDILDVWFDSGVSHAAVVEKDPRLGGRADMYLEGSDQHRGWFHTALLTSLATRNRAPYEAVLTHGFTLDGRGRKMSKSLGNTVAPQDIIKKHGAEILRLWVSAEDYREDVRISEEIINRLVEAYRRLRNTARFLISNLYDFNPATDAVSTGELDELDRWILQRTESILARCREAYERAEFHVVFHALNNFCAVDLSALYLDIAKDRLYCEGKVSTKRRAAQTALLRILDVLVHLMAPVLSFTAEEIWGYLPDRERRADSVFLSAIPASGAAVADHALADKWERIFKERGEILKALEFARSGGIIGHSLDAHVIVSGVSQGARGEIEKLIEQDPERARDTLIVSKLEAQSDEAPFMWKLEEARRSGMEGVSAQIHDGDRTGWGFYSKPLDRLIAVFKAPGDKCQRCWKYDNAVGKIPDHPDVCSRCGAVLDARAAA
jgi:isoleucyl-tRNA synthetase